MLLAPREAKLFFKLHRALMCFVNERRGIVPGIGHPDGFSGLPLETRAEVRDALLDEPGLIEEFAAANPYGLSAEELEIVLSWRAYVADKFFLIRYLKNCAVFLADDPPIAYGVVALTETFEEIIGPDLPMFVETVLLPFRDKIVYDGLITGYNVSFGSGVRRDLNEAYREAKERMGGVVTSLPAEARPAAAEKSTKKKGKRKSARASSDESRETLEAIVGLTDQFCREYLDEEYAALCRKMAEKLARRRPSPLVRGKPEGWAAGIARTIGRINFLSDRSFQPSMKLSEIGKAIGASDATASAKAREIQAMLDTHPLDLEWTLPSRIENNPLVWMLEVNGLIMDIRDAPREAQEIAFRKGLIPYIPADRE